MLHAGPRCVYDVASLALTHCMEIDVFKVATRVTVFRPRKIHNGDNFTVDEKFGYFCQGRFILKIVDATVVLDRN